MSHIDPKTGRDVLDMVDWDHPFIIDDNGMPGDAPGNVYAPSVYNDDKTDIFIDGTGWTAISGYTGQYSYHGSVMHPSEFIGGGLARDLRDRELFPAGTIFAIVTVEMLDDDNEEPIGWTIVYREP